MKPTVLHVIDTTGPGGAETVFLNLAEECAKRGYGSVAVIRGPGWVESQLQKRSIKYYVRDCKGSMNFKFLLELAKIAKREKVTHIQSHLLGSNVYASLLGLLLRIPVTATFHGHVDISEKERLRNLKLGIIRAGAKHTIAVTEDLRQTIIESSSGWYRLTPMVIPNGIDVHDLEAIPLRTLDTQEKPLVFGCLGNVRPAKNYRLAVDFMHHLEAKGVNVRLVIAGDDSKPQALELKEYVRSSGLNDRVEFLGFIDDVPEFLSSIDIFLMTSSSEGHPLALTQALAAGKPVLSTRNGIEKIVPEKLIYLSDEHSPESLSDAGTRLQKTDQLPELLSKAREFVREHYSLDAMFTRYFSLYG
ncbi:glycosyltransferase family 4 protein [Marinobacter fonticola]|uniref:glycosyltransferase family 4 protein n=1 Tax=Marinobacter fonticola TaxID=2603215 RepID=UPI0011E71BE3|nr:glycosyltransferase family 4 protein [Marinobacter fonticola]